MSSAAGHQELPRYTDSDAGEITRISKMGVLTGKGSLTLAMGKCLWFSVKIKVCQSPLSSP